jgi:hypothetical protein
MTGTQWPPSWRIHAIKEDLQSPADMSLYEERGMQGMVQLKVAQAMDRVLAAHDTTTPPTITPTTTTTTEGNKMNNDRPLKFIPARLDAANVLAALSKILSTKFDTIEAAATEITLADLDAGLAQTELSLDDRMRFKFSCGQFGILSKGKRTSINRI